MDWFKLAYTLLGGLGIFFYGMKFLSEGLQSAASHWIRRIINALTKNRVVAVLVGLSVTCFVQSSSITTVMVVGFVNAGLMDLAQAIGIIFGANIGTTITGWIISVKVGKYSLLLIGLGVFPLLFSKKEKLNQLGRVLFALGLIFLGLNIMSGAFKPLRTHDGFLEMMQYFSADTYISLMATVLVGCLLTFMIQSSSAMLGITIALASSGSITFQTALALVMGENIGTTITAILASVGANTTAKRAAAAHAFFNVFGVLTLTSFFWVYKDLVENLVGGVSDFTDEDGKKPYIAAHIAAGHTIFNVSNVLLFIPFLKHLERFVKFLIPEKSKKEKKKLKYFGNLNITSPTLGISQARAELLKMSNIVNSTLSSTSEFLKSPTEVNDLSKKVRKYENITDHLQMEIAVFLSRVMEAPMSREESNRVNAILRMSDELESIADYSLSIVIYVERTFSEEYNIDKETKSEIYALMDRTLELFSTSEKYFIESLTIDDNELKPLWDDFNKTADQMKHTHLERVAAGRIDPEASLTLSDIVVSMRRIKNHTVNFVEAYQGGKQTHE